jgi:hypothetical protein
MSTSETPAELPRDVPAPVAAPAARSRTVGLVLGGIAAAIVILALGFGLGWFSRKSAEPEPARLRSLRRALAVLTAVRVVLSAVRSRRPEARLAAARVHYPCQPPAARTTRTTTIPHAR